MSLAAGRDGVPIQSFAPLAPLSQEYTVGTSDPIDVSNWTAIRWNSKDGSSLVTRVLGDNLVGLTGLGGVDVLNGVTSITFTGAGGEVVEVEGM